MKVPLFKVYWDDSDTSSVVSVISRGTEWCVGPEVSAFEERIAEYVGSKYATVFNSGGSALHAAMLVHRIGPGDEVIVPSFTFIATAYAPMYVGARPVFADIEMESFALDPDSVLKVITPRTKGIILVHYAGIPASQLRALREIAEDYHLFLVEDAAEAFGARVNDKFVGTFGSVGVYSFCQNKIITTGEGGAVVTDDPAHAERLRLVVSYGRRVQGNYFSGARTEYVDVGYNWRMSSISAALGLSQIRKADSIIEMRRRVARMYQKRLRYIDGVEPILGPSSEYSVYQLMPIWVHDGAKTRDALLGYLRSMGVGVKVYFRPVHLEPVFSRVGVGNANLQNTMAAYGHILNVPIYPHMSQKEVDYVASAIEMFFEKG